ncbi:hypothetical protein FD23_GL001209 [Lactobacillus delbrueckii subsp. delbrueckii DSM 20074 = JCM 1012]|nr:hypothetical protein FD23_GL001209 [Lactobacillus delbrueckii subsp. delbrueckii DSM 20074 = JCM 1012]
MPASKKTVLTAGLVAKFFIIITLLFFKAIYLYCKLKFFF